MTVIFKISNATKRLLQVSLLVFLMGYLVDPTFSQTANTVVVDQLVRVPFSPVRAELLIEKSRGQIRRFPAYIISLDRELVSGIAGNGEEVGEIIYVGGVISSDELGSNKTYRVSFVFQNNDGVLVSSKVSSRGRNELKNGKLSADALEKEISSIEQERQGEELIFAGLEERVEKLRAQASDMAGVDEIINLKSQISRLEGFDQEKTAERDRLKMLLDIGRASRDTEFDVALRKDLYTNLSEAAQVTAMADRLNRQRQEAALTSVRQKLEIIRRTQGINPQELAKEALRLRQVRRQLENRLELGGRGGSEDF